MATTVRFMPKAKPVNVKAGQSKQKAQPYFLESWVIPVTAFGGCGCCGGTRFLKGSYGVKCCSNCGASQ